MIITCILFINSNLIYAGGDEVSKTLNKEYSYNENTHLFIKNKFGKVDVKDWDQKTISIEVVIKVEYPDREKAEEILECINVEFKEENNDIYATTVLNSKMDNILRKSENRDFTINYNVYVPSQIQLSVSNKFGDIYIDDYYIIFIFVH